MATAVQQFCLRWNNHQPNFISVFTHLLSNECLVDVTLAAEGKQLQAHKVVLSACSSYFQALFTTNPCQHPIVILKDIKFSDLKTMVDFMYYGEVNVSQDQLPAILKTAETLKIKGLADMPEQLSLSKSTSQPSTDKCDTPSPISPSVLRRKRLRKSSTGSGSEQTSEDTPASGSGSTEIPHSPLKPDPDAEGPSPSNYGAGSLRQEPSTDSEHRDSSHSFEDAEFSSRHVSQEETPESNIKWSCSEENRPGSGAQTSQPLTPHGWTFTESLSVSSSSRTGHSQYSPQHHQSTHAAASHLHHPPPAKAPRKRSVNPQQDENFIAALEAVRSGGLGFCKAAKIYGVNNRTLWLEYKKRGYPLMRPSPKARTSTTDHQSDIFTFKSYNDGNSFQRIKLPGLIAEQPHQSGYEFGNGAEYSNPLFSYSTL